MDKDTFRSTFSMPLGGGYAYPPPPYLYRGVEDLFISYEADPASVELLLPPGVAAADETPVCIAWARWVPFSTFGPYREAYVMIRANFEGETYLYQPFIFCDNEIPLEAGRELWGYAKKLAVMKHNWTSPSQPFGEQLHFTVDRPEARRIMTASIHPERVADPATLETLPVLSTRFISHTESGRPPSVAELVRLDVDATLHNSPDGSPQLWEGRASLTMDSASAVDPWHLLAPKRVTGGWFGRFDFDLEHGVVVHDYLKDDIWP